MLTTIYGTVEDTKEERPSDSSLTLLILILVQVSLSPKVPLYVEGTVDTRLINQPSNGSQLQNVYCLAAASPTLSFFRS